MYHFCSITIVDPSQTSAISSLLWQSHIPGRLPSPLCLQSTCSGMELWPSPSTPAQHISVLHYLQNWPVLLGLTHNATAVSLTISQKLYLFPSPTTPLQTIPFVLFPLPMCLPFPHHITHLKKRVVCSFSLVTKTIHFN